jgi:hypothetical protein
MGVAQIELADNLARGWTMTEYRSSNVGRSGGGGGFEIAHPFRAAALVALGLFFVFGFLFMAGSMVFDALHTPETSTVPETAEATTDDGGEQLARFVAAMTASERVGDATIPRTDATIDRDGNRFTIRHHVITETGRRVDYVAVVRISGDGNAHVLRLDLLN